MHMQKRMMPQPQNTFKGVNLFTIALMIVQPALTTPIPDVIDSQLQALRADCYSRDTCKANMHKDIIDRTCDCDERCRLFDTCCRDSPFLVDVQDRTETPHKCVQVYQNPSIHVFMIDQCNQNWSEDDDVMTMCQGDEDHLSSQHSLNLLTNTRTHKTYKNTYCAICNGETMDDLTPWTINDTEYDTQRNIQNTMNLRYDNSASSRAKQGDVMRLENRIPQDMSSHVKLCHDVISECALNWVDNDVKDQCASHMSVVESGDNLYRNAHCAICNFVDPTSLRCAGAESERAKKGREPLSFALLFDVNTKDGNTVGMSKKPFPKCPDGTKYDAAHQKCREYGCYIPGLVLQGDKCVPAK